jgi:hypothetical protein
VIFSPLTRFWICSVTFSQRSASSSSALAAFSLALAPRPRALRRAVAASARASLTERRSIAPVCLVSSSTSAFASPERRRSVRVSARIRLPRARERSRTAERASLTFAASLRPSLASARTPSAARPASVG